MSRKILSPTEKAERRRISKAESDKRHREKRSAYGKAYQAKMRERYKKMETALRAIVLFRTPLPCGLLQQAQDALDS